MADNISASIIATTIAEVVTIPICTIKTNYQNSNVGITKLVKNIYYNQGLLGFYRSFLISMSSQVLSTTLKYNGYQYFKTKINYKPLAGLSAGIISSLITHPIDVVKVHLQMNQPIVPILKENGLSLLGRGYSKSLAKVSVSSSCFFPIYDSLRDRYDPITASFSSAVITTTLMQPIDYMKIRHIYGLKYFNGYNPLLYFKGLNLNLMRVVPHFIITMNVIEMMK